MIATRPRVVLSNDAIAKILRLRHFLGDQRPEQRALFIEADADGRVVITASSEIASCQLLLNIDPQKVVPGTMLYPFSELVKYTKCSDIVIEYDQDQAGNGLAHTNYRTATDFDISTVQVGRMERFKVPPRPEEPVSGRFSLGAPEFVRAIRRMGAFCTGVDPNETNHHLLFDVDDVSKIYSVVGASVNGEMLGQGILAVTEGRPEPMLILPDTLYRTVKLLYDLPGTDEVKVAVFAEGLALFGVGEYRVSAWLGDGDWTFNGLPWRSAYERVTPGESAFRAITSADLLSDKLIGRAKAWRDRGVRDPGVLMVFDWGRILLLDTNGSAPWADIPAKYEGSERRFTLRLAPIARMTEAITCKNVIFRFDDPKLIEILGTSMGGEIEFRALLVGAERG